MNKWLLPQLVIIAVLAQAFDGSLAEVSVNEYPPSVPLEQVRDRVNRAPRAHPRLLVNAEKLAALSQSVDDDTWRRQLADAIISEADRWLEAAPVTRTLQGRRLLGQSRRCLERVTTLAIAFHLTENLAYARRAEREMLAAARFADWNPGHFLDVAEMTCGLALGYDWLYAQLDPSSREEIRTAIIEKGVELPFSSPHLGWVKSQNNWGQVCHGGLTLGALSVLDHAPQLAARTVHRALENVTHSMAAYAPRGSYPEGPAYWSYGTTYNVLLIAALKTVLGTDFGLSAAPGFSDTGQFPALVCGPSLQYFNFSDGGSTRGPEPAIHWLATRYDRPDWLLGEHQLLASLLDARRDARAGSRQGRFLPLLLLWLRDIPEGVDVRMPLHWNSGGETPISIHRSSWSDPHATFVGLKGGSPSANHGQMDIGSFVLDSDGVRWAIDLGAEGYHRIESGGMDLWNRRQDSDRWTIFRQSNLGHNTLVIGGQLQRVTGDGKFIRFSDAPHRPYSVLDVSSVYQGQATSVQRGVALLPSGEVLIQDELKGLKPGTAVRWGMITGASVQTLAEATVELVSHGQQLTLRILWPSGVAWQLIDTATPRQPWDSPNPGTQMVGLTTIPSEDGDLRLVVLATPGGSHTAQLTKLTVRPLTEWGD